MSKPPPPPSSNLPPPPLPPAPKLPPPPPPLEKEYILLMAIKRQDIKTIKELMKKPEEINITYRENYGKLSSTILIEALLTNNQEIIDIILTHPKIEDIFEWTALNISKDISITTPFSLLLKFDNQETLDKLVKKGFKLNLYYLQMAKMANANNCINYLKLLNDLLEAASNGDFENVINFTTLNPEIPLDFNEDASGSPIIAALDSGSDEVVKFFLDKVDIQKKDNLNRTLLQKLVLDRSFHGIAINLLTNAADRLNIDLDINNSDRFGNTALISACRLGNVEIVSSLLNKNINSNIKNNMGHAAIHSIFVPYAVQSFEEKILLEMLEMFIKKGVDLSLTDHEGNSVLSLAISNDALDCAERLLQDMDIKQKKEALLHKNNEGNFPLLRAAHPGKSKEMEFLINNLKYFEADELYGVLTMEASNKRSIASILANTNFQVLVKFLTKLKPTEILKILTEKNLPPHSISFLDKLVTLGNESLIEEIFILIGNDLLMETLKKDYNASILISLVSLPNQNLFMKWFTQLDKKEARSLLTKGKDIENSLLGKYLQTNAEGIFVNHNAINRIFEYLGLDLKLNPYKTTLKEVIKQCQKHFPEILRSPKYSSMLESDEAFQRRVKETPALTLFTAGESAEMSQKFNNLKRDMQAFVKDPILLYGPLAKNKHTLNLEKITKSILKGEDTVTINKDPLTDKYMVTISSVNGNTENYDLNEILEYCNTQHITLSEEDMQRYVNYTQTISKVKPQVSSMDLTFPTADSFIKRDKDGHLRDLSYAEKLAINIYTGDYNKAMNYFLEGKLDAVHSHGGPLIENVADCLLHSVMACSGLNKVPDSNIKSAYRWEKVYYASDKKKREKRIAYAKKGGDVIQVKSFTSTSYGKPPESFYTPGVTNAAVMFEGTMIGKIVQAVSQFPNENECLISPGQIVVEEHLQSKSPEGKEIDFYKMRSVRVLNNLPSEALAIAEEVTDQELNQLSMIALTFLENIYTLEMQIRDKDLNPKFVEIISNLSKQSKAILQDPRENPYDKLLLVEDILQEALRSVSNLAESNMLVNPKEGVETALHKQFENITKSLYLKTMQTEFEKISQANINYEIHNLLLELSSYAFSVKDYSKDVFESVRAVLVNAKSIDKNNKISPAEKLKMLEEMISPLMIQLSKESKSISDDLELKKVEAIEAIKSAKQSFEILTNLQNAIDELIELYPRLDLEPTDDKYHLSSEPPKAIQDEFLTLKQNIKIQEADVKLQQERNQELIKVSDGVIKQISRIKNMMQYLQYHMDAIPLILEKQNALNKSLQEREIKNQAEDSKNLVFSKKPLSTSPAHFDIVKEAAKFNNSKANPQDIKLLRESLGLSKDDEVIKVRESKIQIKNKNENKTVWKDINELYNKTKNKPKFS